MGTSATCHPSRVFSDCSSNLHWTEHRCVRTLPQNARSGWLNLALSERKNPRFAQMIPLPGNPRQSSLLTQQQIKYTACDSKCYIHEFLFFSLSFDRSFPYTEAVKKDLFKTSVFLCMLTNSISSSWFYNNFTIIVSIR